MIVTVKCCIANEECDLLVIVMTELLKIKLLWPVRQVWLADYCHGAILSASGLFDDHDCAMLYGP